MALTFFEPPPDPSWISDNVYDSFGWYLALRSCWQNTFGGVLKPVQIGPVEPRECQLFRVTSCLSDKVHTIRQRKLTLPRLHYTLTCMRTPAYTHTVCIHADCLSYVQLCSPSPSPGLVYTAHFSIHRCLLLPVPDVLKKNSSFPSSRELFFKLVINFIFKTGAESQKGKWHNFKHANVVHRAIYLPHIFSFDVVMCIKYHRWNKNTFCVLATQLWQLSVEISWISAPVAQHWGCGCTAVSGTIIGSWFQEDPCGILCIM